MRLYIIKVWFIVEHLMKKVMIIDSYGKDEVKNMVISLTNMIKGVYNELKACTAKVKAQGDKLEDLHECERQRIIGEFKAAFRERYAMEETDYYRHFFCDEGLFYHFSRAYGYVEHYLREPAAGGENQGRYFVGQYIFPIQNWIILLRTQLRKHTEDLLPAMKQEMNVNELETSPSLSTLQARLNYLHEQVREKRVDANRLFYEQLWTLMEPFVKQLESGCFQSLESGHAPASFDGVHRFLYSVKAALEQGGLEVVEVPESYHGPLDEEDCFVRSRDVGFATPAIIRRSDHYVFVKGMLPV